jgi:hypothetical protein
MRKNTTASYTEYNRLRNAERQLERLERKARTSGLSATERRQLANARRIVNA